MQIILAMILIYSLAGIFLKTRFNSNHLRYHTFGLTFSIIQLVLGIIFIFTFNPFGFLIIKNIFSVITPILFIFLGWSLHNKQFDSRKKFIRIFIFYGLGLFLLSINNYSLN